MGNQTATERFQPSDQAAQQCFIAHSYNAYWRPTIVEVCQEVLPRFGLQPWYADEHFDTTIPLREKVVEMIATTRYGIYDLSYWKPNGSTKWEMPCNVLIELGMAIALNRPMLLLRHAENRVCNIVLPSCLQGIGQICEFTGGTTLRKTLEMSLPQWMQRSPEQEWRNRYCLFGGLDCSYREEHPKRQWNQGTIQCHIADGDDLDRTDFREIVENTLHRFSDVTFTYLGADMLPNGYNFLLCAHCQRVRSSPFAIYRLTEKTTSDTFIAIGMSIALEAQFGYKIPKILLTADMQHIPSLLSGYEVVVAQDDSKTRRRLNQFLPQVIQKVRQTTWKPKTLPFEVFIPQEEINLPELFSENPEELNNTNKTQDHRLEHPEKDFFVSSTRADREWAKWIAWKLEENGYTVIIQVWDFLSGGNFILEMDEATQRGRRTIVVLSPDYLNALYTYPEWAAAFVQDPTGIEGTLLLIRIEECTLSGLLHNIAYIDLVGLDGPNAERKLLAGISSVGVKPSQIRQFSDNAPPFPDRIDPSQTSIVAEPGFTNKPEQKVRKTLNVFISYAHEDDRFREQLRKHLGPLESLAQIEIWDDRYIMAGMVMGDEINKHLSSADVVLLLVSANFLASDKCYAEMKQALDMLERGEVVVIPIIIRPTDWKDAPFAHIQVLPADGKPIIAWRNIDVAFVDVVKGIDKVIKDLQSRQ